MVLVLALASYGFVHFGETESERIDRLLEDNELVAAREAISDIKTTDSLFLKSVLFRLQVQDSAGDIFKALAYLKLMSDGAKDTLFVNGVFVKYWEALKKRMDKTDPGALTASLQSLATAKTPNLIKTTFAGHLKQRALKQQTVATWNNCIVFWGDDPDASDMVTARRRIFFDTAAILRSGVSIDSVIAKNPCYIPVVTRMDRVNDKAFTYEDLFNPDYPRNDYLSSRYIVGDFNTQDKSGNCRGSYDVFADNSQLPEFKELFKVTKKAGFTPGDSLKLEKWYDGLADSDKVKYYEAMWMWRNYSSKVEHYKTAPLKRDPVIEVHGKQYCIGQRLCLCEIKNDTILMVAQFVTSSRNARSHVACLRDYDSQPRYYAPKCFISSRYWDRTVPYDSLVIKHDKRMGVGSKSVVKYRGAVDLPNFMTISPSAEFGRAMGFMNGIHEFAVGGNIPALYMGTPVSLGCVRLHDYPSKFVRWWTPKNARMFVSYEFSRYIQRVENTESAKE
ncbi:MAG: hypothetical protein ACKOQ6_01735 [Bacteroidota bacterium]